MEISFDELIRKHQNIHFIKRSAHLEKDGVVPDVYLTDNRHRFVLTTLNMLCEIDSSLEFCNSSIKQITYLPNRDWLSKIELTQDKFIVYTYSFFTTILYTLVDQMLLLVNHVNSPEIDEKKVNYKAIQKNIDSKYVELKKSIELLYTNTNEIAQKRHDFIHHGQLRESPMLSSIRRISAVANLFKVPLAEISDKYQEAYKELLILMNNEYEVVNKNIKEIKNGLIPLYETKLNLFGGIDLPTAEEIDLTNEALDYLNGITNEVYFKKS